MAHIGEKRPPERQLGPEDAEEEEEEEDKGRDSSSSTEGSLLTAPKRPASSSIVFRPSPLQKATQGFVLKQSTLKPPSLSSPSSSHSGDQSSSPAMKTQTPLTGGFLKLNSDELKPINVSLFPPTLGSTLSTNQTRDGQVGNDDAKKGNPFMSFVSNSSSAQPTFSSLTSSTPAVNSFTSPEAMTTPPLAPSSSSSSAATPLQDGGATGMMNNVPSEFATNSAPTASPVDVALTDGGSGGGGGGLLDQSIGNGSAVPFGEPATAILPEIQVPTGEEGEKKIVQVPARLYSFDVTTHSWKERGRGEVRLNDAAQSVGLFQSRLVMRASGSYRVLLNTHLWAQMKCEKANQKSIRITAQHDDNTVHVSLIMGAAKDIQQLFTAIDRRIEALKRNTTDNKDPSTKRQPAQTPQDYEDDKESFLGDPHNSSPDSSPEPSSRVRHRPIIQVKKPVPFLSSPTSEGNNPTLDSSMTDSSPPVVVVTPECPPGGGTSENLPPQDEHDITEEECPRDISSSGDSSLNEKESTDSTSNPPSSERSPSCGASTTTISSSDNATEINT